MVNKKLAYLILLLAIAASGVISVHAEEDVTIEVENKMERKTKETRVFMESKKQELKGVKTATAEMELKREEMKKKAEALREEMEKKREEARDRFEKQREEFKEQLSDIKDQKKKTIIENVDQKINDMNEQHTDRLEQVLSKVTDILGRLETKIASMEADGVDTAEADKVITDAKAVIKTATDAITAQAGKQYVIDVSATDEATLRDQVKKTFTTFKSDITSVHEKVKAAREAVVHIARLYGQLHKKDHVSVTPEATTTP